jgi:hypothetical protein
MRNEKKTPAGHAGVSFTTFAAAERVNLVRRLA